jgi:hypothetical protein
MLGHSSYALTFDTYTSVLPEVAREAAEAAARLIPRRKRARTAGLTSGSQAPVASAEINENRRVSEEKQQVNAAS